MKDIKSLFAFLVLLASTALAPSGHAWAQAEQDQWKVVPTHILDDGVICVGAACQKKREDYLAQLLTVCLYRDPSTAGVFARGQWRSHVGENAPQPCQGVMYADTTRRIMYILAQFQDTESARPYIYCPHQPTRHPGFEVCTSEFLKYRDAQGGGYRVVNLPAVQQALQEANVNGAIDRHQRAAVEQQKTQQRAEYLAAFGRAKGSLQAMKQFEEKYGSNDPDGLISQLAGVKQELRLDEYRTRFASMKTIPEIERFIADYEHDDVGKKVPEVRMRLAQERQAEADAAKALARQKAVEDGTKRLSELERKIIWCKRESAAARRAIEQENEIGRVSGFVNKRRLHDAGQTIVFCDRNTPSEFAEYKRLGGKRAYADLR